MVYSQADNKAFQRIVQTFVFAYKYELQLYIRKNEGQYFRNVILWFLVIIKSKNYHYNEMPSFAI